MEPTVGALGEVSMDNEVFIDLNINQPLQGQSAQAQSVRFLPVAPNSR